MPERLDAVLTYCDRNALSVISGVAVSKVYRLNSLFDPDQSGVGHQPMYFDQLTPIYNNYIVTKCEIKIHLQVSPVIPTPMGVGWIVDANGTSAASAQEDPIYTWERENGTYIPLDPAKTRTYTQCVDIAETFGIRPENYRNDLSCWTNVGQNPSNGIYGRLTAVVADNLSSQSMFYQTSLTYSCSFMTRAPTSGS